MIGVVYHPQNEHQPYLAVVLSHDKKEVREATPCDTAEEAQALIKKKFDGIAAEFNATIFKNR